MKKFSFIALAAAFILTLTSCTSSPKEASEIRIGALRGPTAMGMVKLMDDNHSEYTFELTPVIDEITGFLAREELDITAVPANMASVLYNNMEGNVRVLAINTLGVLYIAEYGNTVNDISDLAGKTVYLYGKGATPEYALRHVLEQNNINPDTDLTLEFKSEHSECLTALITSQEAVALLPQPFMSSAELKDSNIRMALDLNAEWEKISGGDSSLITGALIARADFVEENPNAVKTFMERYASSVEWVNTNAEAAAGLIEEYEIVGYDAALKALPYSNIVCITGDEMKQKLSGYFDILFSQNPRALGGALPDDEIYW